MPSMNPNEKVANALDAPIPGQSLTQDPSTPMSWETPPQITDLKEAREYLFEQMTHPDKIGNILFMLNEDIPVSKVAMMLVKQGFRDGMWTPDLLLSLIEPTALMLIAVAKEVGVDPVIIDPKLLKTAQNDMAIEKAIGKKKIPKAVKLEAEGLMTPVEGMDNE